MFLSHWSWDVVTMPALLVATMAATAQVLRRQCGKSFRRGGPNGPNGPMLWQPSLASGFGAPLEVGCKRFDISDILVHDRYVIVRQCKADTMLAELTRSGTAGLAPSLTVSPPDLYDCLALPCWSPLGLRWSPGTTWYNEVLKVVILCKFCRCNMCMKLYECVWYFSCSSVVIAVQTYSMQGNTCTSMSNFRLAPAWSWSKLPNALVPRQIFPPLFTKGLTHGPKPCLIVMVYWPIYGRSCVTAHYVCALFCRWGWWVKTCEDPTSGESYGRFICLSREIRSWSAFQCYPCQVDRAVSEILVSAAPCHEPLYIVRLFTWHWSNICYQGV